VAWVRRYRWWVLAGAAVVLAGVALAVWLSWPEPDPGPEPLTRPHRDFDVCMLMPGPGLSDPQVAAAWSGVVEVARARNVRAQHLAVAGEQSPERSGQFLASLVQQECEVIVAVGSGPVAAVAADRAKYPGSTIVAVGDEIEDMPNERVTASTVEVLSGLVPVG
jgi:hypothetical protein